MFPEATKSVPFLLSLSRDTYFSIPLKINEASLVICFAIHEDEVKPPPILRACSSSWLAWNRGPHHTSHPNFSAKLTTLNYMQ